MTELLPQVLELRQQNRHFRQVNRRYAVLIAETRVKNFELRERLDDLCLENFALSEQLDDLRKLLAASGVHVHPSEAAMATGPRTTPQSVSGRRPAETGGHRDLRDPSTTEETE